MMLLPCYRGRGAPYRDDKADAYEENSLPFRYCLHSATANRGNATCIVPLPMHSSRAAAAEGFDKKKWTALLPERGKIELGLSL